MTTLLSRRDALGALGALAALVTAPAWAGHETALPGNSVYQLPATLTDQDGRDFDLPSLRGGPVIASMFYTSCDMVCPMIFETARLTLEQLHAKGKHVRMLMVSFDPARDTVDVLKKTAQQRSCDSHWTLARADEQTVRKIAAVLGVQYRKLSNGEYNHSSQLILLDGDGRIAARTGKLGRADAAFVKKVAALPV
jgi:protein SCO1/2